MLLQLSAHMILNLDDEFITEQKFLEISLLNSDGNRYKLSHMRKAKLRNRGKSITNVGCVQAAYNLAHNLVKEPE